MRLETPAKLLARYEMSRRDELGSVWITRNYFGVGNDYYAHDAMPVSIHTYSGVIDHFRAMEDDHNAKYFTVENGEYLSHVLLDDRGTLWMIVTLQNAPKGWKPQS